MAVEPLAYGLLNVQTMRLRLPNVYAREEVARLAADRISNRWATYVAVPLFGCVGARLAIAE